jgi:hypothetical protein
MYGPEMFAFFVLCVVLFIGEVFYKETFSDCSSPGALTWTITMNPGSGASMCSDEASGSSSSATSDCSGNIAICGDSSSNGSFSSGSSGNGIFSSGSSGSSSSGPSASASNPFNLSNNLDDYYGHSHHMHHRLGRTYEDDYGYPTESIDTLWRDISGSDVSGNPLNTKYNFNLSLSDLLSLVGKTIVYGDSRRYTIESTYRHRRNELENYDYEEYFQNCKSPSNAQAVDYIKRKNCINMDDYIRKDSIPCYGCTLP